MNSSQTYRWCHSSVDSAGVAPGAFFGPSSTFPTFVTSPLLAGERIELQLDGTECLKSLQTVCSQRYSTTCPFLSRRSGCRACARLRWGEGRARGADGLRNLRFQTFLSLSLPNKERLLVFCVSRNPFLYLM